MRDPVFARRRTNATLNQPLSLHIPHRGSAEVIFDPNGLIELVRMRPKLVRAEPRCRLIPASRPHTEITKPKAVHVVVDGWTLITPVLWKGWRWANTLRR